nr:nuclear pore complex protein NUP35-like [Tanacetum cinerariifolium]
MTSNTTHKTPSSSKSKSLFFSDLETPVTNRRSGSGKFTTPGQAAAVSALWRENFATSDLPPPPVFTLEDRSDFSPEYEYPPDPNTPTDPTRTPPSNKFSNTSPGVSTSGYKMGVQNNNQSGGGGSNWWTGEKAKSPSFGSGGSPMDGVVNKEEDVVLYTLPRPREVVRPEVKRSVNEVMSPVVDEEEWVTVYGFSPGDTNLVIREFEKCGVILKHIPGPRDSNWMHILYQSRFDAQKALSKNGMQLNGALIIGVKPVDPMLRQSLSNRPHNHGFMPLPPQATSTRKSDSLAFNASARPYQQNARSFTVELKVLLTIASIDKVFTVNLHHDGVFISNSIRLLNDESNVNETPYESSDEYYSSDEVEELDYVNFHTEGLSIPDWADRISVRSSVRVFCYFRSRSYQKPDDYAVYDRIGPKTDPDRTVPFRSGPWSGILDQLGPRSGSVLVGPVRSGPWTELNPSNHGSFRGFIDEPIPVDQEPIDDPDDASIDFLFKVKRSVSYPKHISIIVPKQQVTMVILVIKRV